MSAWHEHSPEFELIRKQQVLSFSASKLPGTFLTCNWPFDIKLFHRRLQYGKIMEATYWKRRKGPIIQFAGWRELRIVRSSKVYLRNGYWLLLSNLLSLSLEYSVHFNMHCILAAYCSLRHYVRGSQTKTKAQMSKSRWHRWASTKYPKVVSFNPQPFLCSKPWLLLSLECTKQEKQQGKKGGADWSGIELEGICKPLSPRFRYSIVSTAAIVSDWVSLSEMKTSLQQCSVCNQRKREMNGIAWKVKLLCVITR